ncbi:MerR family transcriptional regulator [Tsukamurella sp. 8F]|uniref:DNA polymerase III subunit beta family protein n=1 Tax=unclassified Tsukamurella TaxID=2633480 RepID=UPI0023B9A135|nr:MULTISPECIES: MerR family transcriptional regulator [unclassified Tsukamurella]MDF0528831.1 MerR family transcriptional regulator [Tsukamurella sp. 8J]MDF0586666.1 MerR family transcriptional regulator [Tsukamurella sp. 8F]
MTDQRLTISSFARATGLTASALRFHGDSGLLPPAEVDPDSGYRYYDLDQIDTAVRIKRLRAVGLPLGEVRRVLEAGPDEAVAILDAHVAARQRDSREAEELAARVRAELGAGPSLPLATVRGPVFAAAVDAVSTAAGDDPDIPILRGILLEVTPDGVTLTATDRYRLTTRTLAVPVEREWSGVLDGDALRLALRSVRRGHDLAVTAAGGIVRFGDTTVPLLAGEYPDYRYMLDRLPAVGTRAVAPASELLDAIESTAAQHIRLKAEEGVVTLDGRTVVARVEGPAWSASFDATVLYPALATAVGPDAMLDLRVGRAPVTVRSADDGALTTLVMPVAPPTVGGRGDEDEG